jgi:hypothetical protein
MESPHVRVRRGAEEDRPQGPFHGLPRHRGANPAASVREVREWGLVHWARPLLDLTFDGTNHAVNHPLEHLLRPHAYYRLRAYIGDKHLRLDDVGPTNLKTICEQLIARAA